MTCQVDGKDITSSPQMHSRRSAARKAARAVKAQSNGQDVEVQADTEEESDREVSHLGMACY